MFDGVKAAFKNIDLRKKILFTLFVIFVFRVGCAIPVPFIDATRLSAAFEASGFEFEDAPEDAGADVDVDFDDE